MAHQQQQNDNPVRMSITVTSPCDVELSRTELHVYERVKPSSHFDVRVPWHVSHSARESIHEKLRTNSRFFVLNGPAPESPYCYIPPLSSIIGFLLLGLALLPFIIGFVTFAGAFILCALFGYYVRKDSKNRMLSIVYWLGILHEYVLKTKEVHDAIVKFKRGETGPAWGHPSHPPLHF